MTVRVLINITKQAHWQKVIDSDKDDKYSLKAFNDESFQIAMYTMLGVGVILDIFCYKYHKLAAVLYIFDCVYLLLNTCINIDTGVESAFLTFASLLTYNLALGCQAGICTISSMLLYFIIELTIDSNPSYETDSPEITTDIDLGYLVYYKILYLISLFVFSTLGFLAINWVLRLFGKL